jgi:hypothetical protein
LTVAKLLGTGNVCDISTKYHPRHHLKRLKHMLAA